MPRTQSADAPKKGSLVRTFAKVAGIGFGVTFVGAVAVVGTYKLAASIIAPAVVPGWVRGDYGNRIMYKPPAATSAQDVERGYDLIPHIANKLGIERGMVATPDVAWKDPSIRIDDEVIIKVSPTFERPLQTGMIIKNQADQELDHPMSPRTISLKLSPRVVKMFTSIEDQEIADPNKPIDYNAGVNGGRIAVSVGKMIEKGVKKPFGIHVAVPGASPIMGQIDNQHNKPIGTEKNLSYKITQQVNAVRYNYRYGADSRQARAEAIVEYINTTSFAGDFNFGELRGIYDAMAAIYGVDKPTFDRLIDGDSAESARVYFQMSILANAVKMPHVSLNKKAGFEAVKVRTKNFVRLAIKNRDITQEFGNLVLGQDISFKDLRKNPVRPVEPVRDKSTENLRAALPGFLDIAGEGAQYKLNRMHATATTTLAPESPQMSAKFREWATPQGVIDAGMTGKFLLRPENAPHMNWNGIVLERLPETGQVVVRFNTDNATRADGRPTKRDANSSGKQNKGSTAKEQTLITHQQMTADLFKDLSKMDDRRLAELKAAVHPEDKLTQFGVKYFLDPKTEKTLPAFLAASKEQTFSGALRCWSIPLGGINCPQNFDKKENGQNFTINEALWYSVNLSWYRIMDEQVLAHSKWYILKTDPRVLDPDITDPEVLAKRREYRIRFADIEALTYLARAREAQKGLDTEGIFSQMAGKTSRSLEKLAVIYLSIAPDATLEQMSAAIRKEIPKNTATPSDDKLRDIYQKHAPHRMIDIAMEMAHRTGSSNWDMMTVFRDFHPQATYEEAVAFIANAQKPGGILSNIPVSQAERNSKEYLLKRYSAAMDISGFKDTLARLQFDSYTPRSATQALAYYTDQLKIPAAGLSVTPAHFMAVHGAFNPDATFAAAKKFVMANLGKGKNRIPLKIGQDLKVEYAAYGKGEYEEGAWVYPFSLPDRAFITKTGRRQVHPLALEAARLKHEDPDIDWNAVKHRTGKARFEIYRDWMIDPKVLRPRHQQVVRYMVDYDAYGPVEAQWKEMGYPFEMARAPGSVIGVSGNTDRNLANMNMILVNKGKRVEPTPISELRFADSKDNPHKKILTLGPIKGKQVIDPEVADSVLTTLRGVILAKDDVKGLEGTGWRLKKGCVINPEAAPADQETVAFAIKTGTNDESTTSGIRSGTAAGAAGKVDKKTGDIDYRYSVSLTGNILDASPKDKFTSGVAVQAMNNLCAVLRPAFRRTWGINPQPLIPAAAVANTAPVAPIIGPMLPAQGGATTIFNGTRPVTAPKASVKISEESRAAPAMAVN